jgi:hypothetical protein
MDTFMLDTLVATQDEKNQGQEMVQDLKWQKPEESDNLQKSERPADDYMDSRGLDRDTHGKKDEVKK